MQHRTFTCPDGKDTSCRILFGLGYYEHGDGSPCDFCNSFLVGVDDILATAVRDETLVDTRLLRLAIAVSADVRTRVYGLLERVTDMALVQALRTYCEILYALGIGNLTVARELFATFGPVVVQNLLIATGHDFTWVQYTARQPYQRMQALTGSSLTMTLRSRIIASFEEEKKNG